MKHEIIIGGRGGQGVQLMGYLLGYAFVKYRNLYVVQTEEYGASTRGGESYTELIVSDKESDVAAVKVRSADVGIFMFQGAWDALSNKVKEDGIIIYDGSLVNPDKGKRFDIRAGDLARDVFKTAIVANMIMLGSMSAITGIVSIEELKNSIKEVVNPRFIELNTKAVEFGYSEALKLSSTSVKQERSGSSSL
ncbi:MAG: 2-oxoacid:acceptor oxidoreductase family protein [Nitrososphaeria archaeon]|nr:2-oxoacid:acceptor oxidoreductase family protein [Conexivisphaerales archaeon]